MDKNNGSSLSPQKGGNSIYRNLMMPGFTDAGAGTSYMPKAVIPRRTAAAPNETSVPSGAGSSNASCTLKDDHDVDDFDDDENPHCEDTFSEAGTELHDNRTGKSAIDSKGHLAHYVLKSSVTQERTSTLPNQNISTSSSDHKSVNNHRHDQPNYNFSSNGENIEVEANYGFFPSTKPPPSPSLRSTSGLSGTREKRFERHSNTPKSPCPHPISPPPVTRKQLVSTKRSTSTTVAVGEEIEEMAAVTTKTTSKTTSKTQPPKKNFTDPGNSEIESESSAETGGETSQQRKKDMSTEQALPRIRLHQRPLHQFILQTQGKFHHSKAQKLDLPLS